MSSRKNRKVKVGKITVDDFLKANRKASRDEEIALHGKPVCSRKLLHKSKKTYDRKRLKRAGSEGEGLPFS